MSEVVDGSWSSSGSVVGSWLLDLTDVLRAIENFLSKYGGGVSDSGEGRWTLHAYSWILVYSFRYLCPLFERFNSRRLGEFGNKILNGMRYMFGGHHVHLMFLNGLTIPFVLSTIYFGIRKGEK